MKRFYFSTQNIIDYFCEKYIDSKNVLEIGPGNVPFPKATHFVDLVDHPNGVKMDICNSPLPFPDNFFDFTYCRHVLEDTCNPFYALREIIRVSKAVYIETPSPLIETTKEIQYFVNGSSLIGFAGYIHHRYIIWFDNETNTIYLLPKFPLVEHITYNVNCTTYLSISKYWNTYIYFEKSNVPKIVDYINSVNYDIEKDYFNIIINGVNVNIQSTNDFFETLKIEDDKIRTTYMLNGNYYKT